jgi:ribulose 1,5-bisphosphate synthetase/thiazole synthase
MSDKCTTVLGVVIAITQVLARHNAVDPLLIDIVLATSTVILGYLTKGIDKKNGL